MICPLLQVVVDFLLPYFRVVLTQFIAVVSAPDAQHNILATMGVNMSWAL